MRFLIIIASRTFISPKDAQFSFALIYFSASLNSFGSFMWSTVSLLTALKLGCSAPIERRCSSLVFSQDINTYSKIENNKIRTLHQHECC